MNRLNRALYLLGVLLAAAACGQADGRHHEESQVTITRTWPATAVREIRVAEIDGNVTVEASPSAEVTLVAKVRGDLEPKKGVENDGLFETSLSGDVLRIGRRDHDRHFRIPMLFGRDEVHIDYALRVPTSVSLDLNTVNGRIATRGIGGDTEAVTVNGTIDIETPGTAELRATTVNGRVKAKFLQSFTGAKFRTVNGGVEASLPPGASFNVDMSQVNGDFEAAFPLSIHSNPGSRRVSGDVNGGKYELKIVTVNGDVELSQLRNSL